MNSFNEDKVKESFKRVKEHIEALESEIRANRMFIIQQNEQIKAQNEQILLFLEQNKTVEGSKPLNSEEKDIKKEVYLAPKSKKKPKKGLEHISLSLKNENSIRKKGVSLNGYSLPGYSLPGYSLDIHKFREELPSIISRVSRQEFLTFLTIYKQEEQIGKVTYESVAQELKITAGCIRTYISGLIKKGLPVVKTKYNNKIIILAIPPEIRGLNMKKQLIQIFYNQDPQQRKLEDHF